MEAEEAKGKTSVEMNLKMHMYLPRFFEIGDLSCILKMYLCRSFAKKIFVNSKV